MSCTLPFSLWLPVRVIECRWTTLRNRAIRVSALYEYSSDCVWKLKHGIWINVMKWYQNMILNIIKYYIKHTSWKVVVTPSDRPKSVRNRYVIENFGGVIVLSLCFLKFSVGVEAFVTLLSQIFSFSSLKKEYSISVYILSSQFVLWHTDNVYKRICRLAKKYFPYQWEALANNKVRLIHNIHWLTGNALNVLTLKMDIYINYIHFV